MKIASFAVGSSGTSLGVIIGGVIVPLPEIAGMPKTMIDLIRHWSMLESDILAITNARVGALALDRVQLLAPVPNPTKILAIGLNYADHVAEAGLQTPENQLWFAKQVGCVNGPHQDVEIPKVSIQIDYEVELVAVIGKRGRHISIADAPSHVFGYCVGNDVSVRDWQMMTTQWVLGKSFDTHGPIGPYVTTADEIGDPHRLGIRCLVNGELRQNSNTKHLIFGVFDQIAHLSKAMTLEPGDLIFTGTPGGVGFAMKPPRFLKDGDIVRCEIDELGVLENRMANEL